MKKEIIIILSVLVFLNLSSVLIKRDGSSFDLISYAVRIALYFYVILNIYNRKYPKVIQNHSFFKLCYVIPLLLLYPLILSIIDTNDYRNSISMIFPTFFLFADNLFFMYVGFYSSLKSDESLNVPSILRSFALLSIIGMTLITVYVITKYGNLVGMWNFAKSEGGSYTVFLNAYKNANPYKFAILIPFLFLKNNRYNLLFVVICIINILIAGKKGPLLGIIMSTAFLYLFVWHKRTKIYKYCAYLIIILFLYILLVDDSLFQTLAYRLNPSEHYNASADISFYSSGRDRIWYTILNGFFESNFFSQFMGHGTVGAYTYLTAHHEPQNAHNTWFEILFNFGIVGIIIFIYYYIVLIQICIKMNHTNYKWKSIAVFLVLFNLLSTFYTVTYRAGFAFAGYANMLLSYLLGNYMACKPLIKGKDKISYVDIVRCYLLKSRKEMRNTISSNM